MELEKLTEKVCGLALRTGGFIRSEVSKIRAGDIELKSANNFVTYVDKSSEQQIIEGLSKILPGTGFIAEESPRLESRSLNWIIDPLDGTTNFIHGVPMYCISIALAEENDLKLGVVLEVNSGECFSAWEGSPSLLNGREIRVSPTPRIADSLFATGFPYYDFTRLGNYMEVFTHLMKNSHGVRRLGSAAADLAYVACGRYDGFYEYGLSPWDVAAGSLIVKNAGGRVADFSGGPDFLFGKEIIATNAFVFKEFLGILEKYFPREKRTLRPDLNS